MSELKHPNIITLYGTAAKDPHLYIVMGWFCNMHYVWMSVIHHYGLHEV